MGDIEEKPVQKFRPGTQKVHVKVSMTKNPGSELLVGHDLNMAKRVAASFASETFTQVLARLRDGPDQDEWETYSARTTYLLFGKKLAHSLHPDQGLIWGGDLANITRLEMGAPGSLVTIANGLGCVQTDDVEIKLAGQAFVSMSYVGRALADGQLMIDRDQAWFINLAWGKPFDSFVEYCLAVLRHWVATCPPMTIALGGNNLSIGVPVPSENFATYRQFVANVPKTILVDRVLTCLELVEAVAGAPTPDQINAMSAQGLYVVNWQRNDYSALLSTYEQQVQRHFMGFLRGIMTCADVTSMGKTGSGWQALKDHGDGMATSPFKVGGSELEFGWMLAGATQTVCSEKLFILHTDETANSKLAKYMRGGVTKPF